MPPSCLRVSAIVLAAGRSRRLGRPKLLLPLGSSTVLEQTVDHLLLSRVAEVIVVVGDEEEEMRKLLAPRPVRVVPNRAHRQGMSTSIIAGLKAVDPGSGAVLIALADQPFVASTTVNHLLEEFHRQSKGIVVPVYRGKRGNPVIFSLQYRGEFSHLKGDIGGREIVRRHPDDVLEVLVNSEGVLIDLDTARDYRRYSPPPQR
ncbi:MAG: nucleotidyltransferase family protein [Chloroflexota bacterium]